MQALIDFDGWRKWKDFAEKSETMDSKSKMSASFSSIAPKKKQPALDPSLAANPPDGSGMSVNGIKKDEEKKNKRKSVGVMPQPVLMEESEGGTPDAEGSGA
jgi:osomolarity two-component system response regulator SSK1